MNNVIEEILEITKKHKYLIDHLEFTQSGTGGLFLDLTLREDCEEVVE